MKQADKADARKLLARLAELDTRCGADEPWLIVRETHSYNDGTTHFTHVEQVVRTKQGDTVTLRIASNLTPDLAELMTLGRNNLADLVRWARAGLESLGEEPKDERPDGGDAAQTGRGRGVA